MERSSQSGLTVPAYAGGSARTLGLTIRLLSLTTFRTLPAKCQQHAVLNGLTIRAKRVDFFGHGKSDAVSIKAATKPTSSCAEPAGQELNTSYPKQRSKHQELSQRTFNPQDLVIGARSARLKAQRITIGHLQQSSATKRTGGHSRTCARSATTAGTS